MMFLFGMQTIGEQLRQARTGRDISLEEAVQATAIRLSFLKALEADDFESLPSPVQARGFLRNYAGFLGLDPVPLLARLRRAEPPPELVEKVDEASQPPDQRDTAHLPRAEPAQPLIAQISTSPAEVDDDERHRDGDVRMGSPASADVPDPDERTTETTGGDHRNSPSTGLISHSIFLEIGEQLAQRRELLGLSPDEVERHTHIPRHHLARLEAGELEDLPAAVQARGMLTAYARFLDLDAENLLLRYADGLIAERDERHPRSSARRRFAAREWLPASVRGFLSTDLVVGGGMILALAVFALWGAARVLSLRAQEGAAPTGESISAVLLATPGIGASVTPTAGASGTQPSTEEAFAPIPPSGPSETPTAFPTRFSTSPVQLIVAAGGRTWMRITVDGKIEFEGRTTPGAAYSFEGAEQVELLVADASAISLIYNREELGSPGGVGEVVNLIYTADAVLLPSPTITPSPTRTPRPSATPRPTATPRIPPTPRSTEPMG